MAVLAIDQGTSSTRALRVDDDGTARITHAVKHRQFYPASGRVEHDPEELIRSITACIEANPGVNAIGIDNQGESCLAWNADSKQPVSPVIVWQDNRTAAEIERLESEGVNQFVMDRAGLPLDSYFSATKLAWILENVAEAKQLLRRGKLRLGTTDAFFLDRLANRFVTDITTASRTSLFNIESGQWDDDLCRLFNVPVDSLPEIVPTTGELGFIESGGKSIPVTASIVDQQASLYGHGCRNKGDAKITFGTGAFALAVTGVTPFKSPDQGLLPTIAWQHAGQAPVYALDGGVYSAGSAIDWARGLGLFDSYASINHFDENNAIERGLVFVPALSGLACPHWDRRAGGLWIGLSLNTTPHDMIQAVLEGIALRTSEVIRTMEHFIPVAGEISIDGGVSTNPYFCQFLASTMNRRVVVRQFQELTALGTAQLAGADTLGMITSDNTGSTFEPAGKCNRFIERFDEAVERCREWHPVHRHQQ